MKIAVAYDRGQVFGHFGRTEAFKVYSIVEGRIESAEIIGTEGNGHGALAGYLVSKGVEVLICGGLGAGAQQAIAQAGIMLYAGVSGNADHAVEALLRGELKPNAAATCDHHDHDGSRDHDHGSCGSGGCGHQH